MLYHSLTLLASMIVKMSDHEFTIVSPFKNRKFPVGETVPEYLLKRCEEMAGAGLSKYITDTITGESFEYTTFDDVTRKMASALYKRGLRAGDIVVYLTTDMVKWPLFSAAVWRANGILRASYPEDDKETLFSRIHGSRVGWVYCEPETAALCLEVANDIYWDVEVIVTGESEGCISIYELMNDDGDQLPELSSKPEDPALILCTSGTTGGSKGAVISHEAVLSQIFIMSNFPCFLSNKPNLICSKATHITGSIISLSNFVAGKETLVMSKITKETLFNAVHTYKPGFIWGFPTFLLLLVNDSEALNYDFSSLDIVATGGVQVTPAIQSTLKKLPNVTHVLNVYGLTEVVPISSHVNLDSTILEDVQIENVPVASVGKLCTGNKVQIRNCDTLEVLGPNQTGEICVQAPGIFTGYLNNEKATKEAFVDGFFKTGDVGYYDENEFLFIVDRAKEIFKYYNNHISPTELEAVINTHFAVSEVCVVGVEDPEGGGQIPRAFVTVLNCSVSADDILHYANSRLASYKHLRGGIYIVPDLPKGKTGKITRQLVAQLIV